MITFFFVIIFIALIVVLLVPALLFSVVRTILSMLGFVIGGKRHGSSSSSQQSYRGENTYGQSYKQSDSARSHDNRKKKMFDKDEGEYVDFEEIKD